MKKYLIKRADVDHYVTGIYRTSINISNDMGDAIELTNEEDAKVIKKIVEERSTYKYKIICVELVITSIE